MQRSPHYLRLACWARQLGLAACLVAMAVYCQSLYLHATSLAGNAKGEQTAHQTVPPSSTGQASESTKALSSEQARQAKIQADTQRLYELSAQLRAEVARTYKESLSLNVLRKAEEIEKLARSLKAEMNEEAAAAKRKN
jgi:uncharacterized protein YlxW (UPF0749 family)